MASAAPTGSACAVGHHAPPNNAAHADVQQERFRTQDEVAEAGLADLRVKELHRTRRHV